MRLYTIPTNRVCIESAVSYLKEIKYLQEKYAEEFLFLVLGDGVDDIEKENLNSFEEWNQKSDLKIHYVPRATQCQWLEKVVANSGVKYKEKLFDILHPKSGTICYGAVLNKSFLIGESLKVESIHRRDSDTKLMEEYENYYPAENEIKYLGKQYKDIPELHSCLEKEIFFVGGNYSGAWAGDFSALYNRNPHLLYRHVALNFPGRPMEEIRELVEKRYGNVNKTEKQNGLGVRLVMDRMIELGNCAFHKVLRMYPVSPACETMATDYFIHDLMFCLNLPNVYHSSRVLHYHTEERKNDEWFFSYHLRSARYKVYNRFMGRFFSSLKKWSEAKPNVMPGSEVLGGIMEGELEAWDYKVEGREILEELGKIFLDSGLDDFVKLSGMINNNIDGLLNYCVEGIKDFILLLNCWKSLAASAREVNFVYRQ